MKIRGMTVPFSSDYKIGTDFKPFDDDKIIIEWSANWFTVANDS